MTSEPTATCDARPVVAAGLCLIAVILAWPLLRHRGDDDAASFLRDDDLLMRRPAPQRRPAGNATARPAAEPAQKAGMALPPGYIRHYQTTDDGKQLPPILTFHPDFHPVDDQGRPIPLPADRVVPPEMAPPGLPHDVLQPPPTHVPLVGDPPR